MNERGQQLLTLLNARLHLSAPEQHKVHHLFCAAYEHLEQQRGSSPSLLGQEQPCAEDVWAPCIVWLLKSTPGLLESAGSGLSGQESSSSSRPSLPLSELLDASGTSLVSFFKELPVVLNKLKPWLSEVTDKAEIVENVLRLREWQETLVSLTHLANKYKDLFWHIQRSSSNSASKQPLLRAGWLAFLVIKAQLLPGFPDLVSCLELLVCVLNMLLASSTFSERQLQELQEQSPSAIGPAGTFNTLKALSHEAKVDSSNTQALMPQIEACFRAHLEEASFSWLPRPLPAQLPHPQADRVDTCCSLYLEGLGANQQQLSELVLSLDGAYQAWYNKQGEIDERDFLLTDFGGLASPRALPGAAIHMPAGRPVKAEAANGSCHAAAPTAAAGAAAAAGAPSADVSMAADTDREQLSPLAALAAAATSQQRQQHAQHPQQHPQHHVQKPPLGPGGLARKGGLVLQGLQSPLPMMNLGPPGPATPISQAMGSVSWLRSLARGLPLEPSTALQRYMEAAGADAGRVLVERVNAAAAAVFMSDAAGDPVVAGGLQGLQHGLAQERQTEGIKLYWHVLEAMLKAEEARAGLRAAGALLTRWSFHQCLLACAFEVVAASYRMGLLSFPAIPAKLGLKPFDLSKMIGPFVKAEPTLPRELKRHMFTVEEKILESLGWAPGSSFYRLIRAATGQQQQPPARAAAADGAGPTRSTSPADADSAPAPRHASDAHMQESEQQPDASAALPSLEQQQELQQEAAAAAALDAQQPLESGTPSAAAAAEARRRQGSAHGMKRNSDTGSGDPMDTDAGSRASASPSLLSVAAKRQRGHDGLATDSPRNSPALAAAGEEPPLPRALGAPPGSTNAVYGASHNAGGAAAGDPSAQAVLHDYCSKVLKLAAFRLVAVSEGLDFSPMTREEVVAQVHDLLAAALYQHTYLFYSRHLDTMLLACLYGWCKVNRLNQITFREIIAHYKRQAHAKQEVFRTVVLQQTDPYLVTQSTGDIIAFYNVVFVPAMKGVLLTISHQQQAGADSAAALAASSLQQLAGGLTANGVTAADATGGKPSPMQTALQLTAVQQQHQYRRAVPPVTSPGSSGSAYRALSLPGGPSTGGGSSSSLGLAALGAGSSLLGSLGGPYSSLQPAAAQGHNAQPAVGGAAGGSGFWPAAGDGTGRSAGGADTQVPAAAAGAAAAAAGDRGSGVPSRLSRLSRAGAPSSPTMATAVEAVPAPGANNVLHPKAAAAQPYGGAQVAAATHPDVLLDPAAAAEAEAEAAAAAAAADAMQQPDQGRARLSDQGGAGINRLRSGTPGPELTEPYSASAGSAAGLPTNSSTQGMPGEASTGLLQQQQQQQQRVHHSSTGGAPPVGHTSAAAAAVSGSPSAGLATLLQALDTTGAGMGAAGQASGQDFEASLLTGNGAALMGHHSTAAQQAGHLPSTCGKQQQQTAIMMDM